MELPKLYAIADAGVLQARGVTLRAFALQLRAAEVELVQWRHKLGLPQEVLEGAATLSDVFAGTSCRLIMNDRADLALLAGFGGLHVGQGDLSPDDARVVLGTELWVGISTHTEEQVQASEANSADYVAIGPIFVTGTKRDAAAPVGLTGVRRTRALTSKPLVAIGGITRENARSVMDAGADSVAVISGFFVEGEAIEKVARDFLRHLR